MTDLTPEAVLLKMPAQIRQAEATLFKEEQVLEGLRLRLKGLEGDFVAAIAKENAETKAFPNADARDAELRRRLQDDAAARDMRQQLVEQERVRTNVRASLDYYRALQQNARVLVLARSPSALIFDDPEVRW